MSQGTLFLNGRVHTLEPGQPLAAAVAVRDGRIVAVGSNEDLRALSGPDDWRMVDLRGRAMLPAFADCHLHFLSCALEASRLSLEERLSLDACLGAVQEYVRQADPGAWVRGWGWSNASWPEGAVSWREALDRVAPEHPAVLTKKDGHVIWVNSEALRRAGLDEDTPDPPESSKKRPCIWSAMPSLPSAPRSARRR
jgi:predicted amidohydrolase YtcJ